MFTIELKMIENHFDELEKRLKELSKSESTTGYFQEQGIHEPSNLSYPHIVGILSSGYSPNNLPARPIFDIVYKTFKLKDSRVEKDLTKYFSDIKKKGSKITTEEIQKHWVKDLSDAIDNTFGKTPPLEENAPSVQKRKGRNAPLIDTGDLKDNLAYKIDNSPYKLTKTLG